MTKSTRTFLDNYNWDEPAIHELPCWDLPGHRKNHRKYRSTKIGKPAKLN